MSATETFLTAFPPAIDAKVIAVVQRARRGRIGGCTHLDDQPVATVCLILDPPCG